MNYPVYRTHTQLGALLCLMACAPETAAAPNAATQTPTAPPAAAGASAIPTVPLQPPMTPPVSLAGSTAPIGPIGGSVAPPAAMGGRAAPPMIAAGAPASLPGTNTMMGMAPRAGAAASAPTAGGGASDDAMLDMLRQTCVDTINMYRATKMLGPLTRKMDQETCSDAGAKKDGDSMQGHSSAFSCRGSTAQNSCPGYPVGGFGGATLNDTFKTCMKQMWDEGEPPVSRAQCQQDATGCFEQHGHYLNMTGTFRSVACGFYHMKNGNWWMNQDFF